MAFFVRLLLWYNRKHSVVGATQTSPTFSLTDILDVLNSLKSNSMRPSCYQIRGDHDMTVPGKDQPFLVHNTVSIPTIWYGAHVYRPFRYFAFSLSLNNSSDLWWHKWSFLDRASWSEKDVAPLGVTIIGAELALVHGLRRYLLVHSSKCLRILAGLTALLLRTTMFWRTWLLWRKRGCITASTFLYTLTPSVFTSCCARSWLMSVITGVMARGVFSIALFL